VPKRNTLQTPVANNARARTGRPRTNALIYYKDGASWVVVASNGGSDQVRAGWRISGLNLTFSFKSGGGSGQRRRGSPRRRSGRGSGLSSTAITGGWHRSFTPALTVDMTPTSGIHHAPSRSSFSRRPMRRESCSRNPLRETTCGPEQAARKSCQWVPQYAGTVGHGACS
jgi:F420H(2)-dependent quinone reductase